jgi:hypothetical protein
MQLNLAEHAGANPHSEDYCLPDNFICQPATVLAILARKEGITITVEHALLPKLFMDNIEKHCNKSDKLRLAGLYTQNA